MLEIHDDEVDLVYEALHDLRKKKMEAFEVVHNLHPDFTPAEFGVPTIDVMLKRIDDRED